MGFSLVQSKYQKFTFANPAITLTGAPTAGNTLIVFFGGGVTGTHPIDTTKWTVEASDGSASSGSYHVLSRVVQAGDGAALPNFLSSSDTGSIYYVIVAEFNHTGGKIVFDTHTAYTGSSPVTGPASTQNDELAVMMQFQGGGFGTYTPGSGYTNIQNDGNWSSAADYKILATSGSSSSASPGWSVGGSSAHYFTSLWKVLPPPNGDAAQTFTGISQAALGAAGFIGFIVQTFQGISQALAGEPVPPPTRLTQGARLALVEITPPSRLTQGVRLTLVRVATPERITSATRLALIKGRYPLRVTQAVRLALVDGVPCVTKWQQLWTITRRDGVVFRYTSRDVDFDYGGFTYKACGSLNPSAGEDAGAIGAISNIELQGIFKDDAITEEALYGGLFDDAFVDVWLVPYEGTESPRLLASGWCGNLKHGEDGFNMEVVGPGARVDQQALVQAYTPGCRWVFGSSQCGIDREAIKVTGVVSAATSRASFVGTAVDPAAFQWNNGLVRWTSGDNDGLEYEVKTAVFGGGEVVIELWDPSSFKPAIGDTFDLLPGCDLSKPTCKDVYNNVTRFGGFDKVPGQDSVAKTPDAKIDE